MVRNLYWISIFIAVASSSLLACSVPSPLSSATPRYTPVLTEELSVQQKWNNLVEAAKNEGTILIYANLSPEVRESLAKAFKSKFGLTVEYIAGTGPEVTRKILLEKQAGLSVGDIFIGGTSSLLNTLKPQGALESVEPLLVLPEVLDSGAWKANRLPFIDKDSMAVALIATYSFYILINTNLVKPDEIQGFDDLLQAKWKNKMVMYDPTVPGPGGSVAGFIYTSLGKEKADKFMHELAKQEPVIIRDVRQQIEWVSQGKYPIGVGPQPEPVAQFIEMGAPIRPVRTKEGAFMATVSGGMAVLAKSPHQNARRVFVNWILTKEGSTVFSTAFGHPSSRKDVPTTTINPLFIPNPQDKVVLETEEYYASWPEMFANMRQIFGPLMK